MKSLWSFLQRPIAGLIMVLVIAVFLSAQSTSPDKAYSPDEVAKVISHGYLCGRIDGLKQMADRLGKIEIVEQIEAAAKGADCDSVRELIAMLESDK